jgi:hypothetical protein
MVGTIASPTTDRFLGIYINDHRAGAVGGTALAKRCQRENEGTPLGEALAIVIPAIEEDAGTLNQVAEVLGVRSDPVKLGAARAGEIVSRLKLNGQVRGYSPLSRVIELEGLLSAIEAKRLLWKALKAAQRPELSRFDFTALARRAADQRDLLKPHHRLATQLAFSASGRGGGDSSSADDDS